MTVHQLETQMSAVELDEWWAYYKVEPFGEWRGDLRMAILAALYANVKRDRDERSEPYSADDFMPRFGMRDDPGDEDTVEEMKAALETIATIYGRKP